MRLSRRDLNTTLNDESKHIKFWYPNGRKKIQSLINLYETQLQFVPKYHTGRGYGSMNIKWVELTSKLDVCRGLLNG